MATKAQADFLRETNQYLRALPTLFDGKIAILIAGSIGVLLFNFGLSKDLEFVGPSAGWTAGLLFLCLAGAWAGCVVATATSLGSLWPRIDGNQEGVSSFVEIGAYSSAEAYLASLLEMNADQMAAALARHNFELAQISRRKVLWANRAVKALGTGMLLTAISVMLITFAN